MEKDDEISKIDVEGDFYKTFEKINEDASLNLDLSTYPNKYELSLNVYKEYVKNFDNSIKGNKVEINKIVRDLKSVGFISSSEASSLENYDKDELLNLTYFADALEIQYENKLIEKYELALQNEQEKLLAGEGALYNAYVNLFKTQQNKFDGSYTDYETALSNASDSNLVLYNPDTGAGKYGYVLNLLIGFSDEQSAILTALDEKVTLKKEDRDNARKALLNGLVAKDQRSSWIESNYGVYDETANSFTFKDSYCGTSLLNTFYGSLYGAKKYVYHDSYDEEVDGYSFESIKAREIPFNEFYETIVLGAMGVSNTDRSGVIQDLSDEQIDTFKDLIYAFSTDPGSLSSANGYVYSPKTSATTYVKEFSAAAKELVNDVNKGKGAYTVVATDYGYHILLCVEVIEPTTAMIERTTFETDMLVEGTIPYLFREYQKARLVVDNVDKITSKFFNDNLESSVTYYEDTYEDLF
ncbi:MAG: hypothetical protein J6V66_02555 [Clostridia bacterium]|nr:hypothetical protein [Clostridia bacterium]